jgi:phosphoribosylglycinamide formyltransferase 1
MNKFRVAILASGSGTNAEKIMAYFQTRPTVEIALVLSNNALAMVHQRAASFNVPSVTFTREEFSDSVKFLAILHEHNITHIVLAGFLWLIPDYLIRDFPNRIINIHPALLPKYGGKGMYGSRVHQAVKDASERETGITIHLVNESYDEGEVLFQKKCKLEHHMSADQIAACVHKLEYEYYPKVIEKWITGSVSYPE